MSFILEPWRKKRCFLKSKRELSARAAAVKLSPIGLFVRSVIPACAKPAAAVENCLSSPGKSAHIAAVPPQVSAQTRSPARLQQADIPESIRKGTGISFRSLLDY
jgi:hypothetical protein